jgi:hypothetical protein
MPEGNSEYNDGPKRAAYCIAERPTPGLEKFERGATINSSEAISGSA